MKCPANPCIGDNNTFSRKNILKRINNEVRMPASLYMMKKSTLHTKDYSIKTDPITKKKYVNKKHFSYSRYLARRKCIDSTC